MYPNGKMCYTMCVQGLSVIFALSVPIKIYFLQK